MGKQREIIVILHGLLRSPLSMMRLHLLAKQAGYDVANWSYLSVKDGFSAQLARLEKRLPELEGYEKVHGIGHSLGGLHLRGLFGKHPELPLGRLVMLGTPNHGAGIVNQTKLSEIEIPVLQDLARDSEAIRALPIPNMEIGTIAGVEPFNPLNPVSWVGQKVFAGEKHDGTVEASSVQLKDAKDHTEIVANHSFLPLSREACALALHFIQYGSFK